jgi:hypothetical protein
MKTTSVHQEIISIELLVIANPVKMLSTLLETAQMDLVNAIQTTFGAQDNQYAGNALSLGVHKRLDSTI